MTYSLHQLQETTRKIVAQLTDKTDTPISGSKFKRAYDHLFESILSLSKRNRKKIVVSPTCEGFTDFFSYLNQHSIQFPSKSYFVIHRSGESYQKRTDSDQYQSKLYNRRTVKTSRKHQRTYQVNNVLREALADLAEDWWDPYDFDDASSSEDDELDEDYIYPRDSHSPMFRDFCSEAMDFSFQNTATHTQLDDSLRERRLK